MVDLPLPKLPSVHPLGRSMAFGVFVQLRDHRPVAEKYLLNSSGKKRLDKLNRMQDYNANMKAKQFL